jgi:glucosamine 6-phosphate synthetase-like amidotransferase/phosphosugar isomerase protein
MCGIFGSYNFRRFTKLYDENKQRGNFAVGTMYVTTLKEAPPGLAKDTYKRKKAGVVDLSEHYSFHKDYVQFLGHTQAPTSANRSFSPTTTHPFESVHYTVAHNGVLENHRELSDEYMPDWWDDTCVDSEIIPAMLSINVEFDEKIIMSHEQETGKTEDVLTIEKTCSQLRGIFGCWVYSKLTGDTFIVRNGSTLFGNVDTGDFSSVPVEGICEQELKQGVVYCVTSEGLTECGEFETNSQFFL